MRLPERARPVWAWIVARQPWSILVPLLAVQWLALIVFAVTVRHNGWLYYQGGDQTYYWTDAHLLSTGRCRSTAVGYAWSYLLTPIALISGANVLSGLPVVIVLNALVLVPIALLCVYGIATRIAGRFLGYWAAFLWMLIPYAAIPMFDQRYHQKYVELTLPQQFGLTVLGDFPSMVCLLVTAYLLVRALDSRDWRDTVLAGLAGSFAIGIKPSNALFFGAAVLCLLVARRWTQTGALLAAMIPGLLVLALWKQRGLGELPAFSSLRRRHGRPAPRRRGLPLGSLTSPFQLPRPELGPPAPEHGRRPRVLLGGPPARVRPVAGVLAIGRRSWPKAVLIFGWFATFLLIKGTDDKANVEDASFFRLLMPSFPAFLLLLASIPLLVPTFGLTKRACSSPRRRWRPGRRLRGGATVAVALPLIVIAGTRAQSAEAVTDPREDVYVPVRDIHLKVQGSGRHRRIAWDVPYSGPTGVYYTLFARVVAPDPTSGNGQRRPSRHRLPRPAERRLARVPALHEAPDQPAGGTTYVDRLKRGRWTYRVGVRELARRPEPRRPDAAQPARDRQIPAASRSGRPMTLRFPGNRGRGRQKNGSPQSGRPRTGTPGTPPSISSSATTCRSTRRWRGRRRTSPRTRCPRSTPNRFVPTLPRRPRLGRRCCVGVRPLYYVCAFLLLVVLLPDRRPADRADRRSAAWSTPCRDRGGRLQPVPVPLPGDLPGPARRHRVHDRRRGRAARPPARESLAARRRARRWRCSAAASRCSRSCCSRPPGCCCPPTGEETAAPAGRDGRVRVRRAARSSTR